jgi:nucleotide-binding universal stress UspA family protein
MATKQIVVGVDGSEGSLQAAEWAAMEARRHSAPLHIVSAPATLPRMHAYRAPESAVAGALRAVSSRALEAARTRSEEVAPGLSITTGLLSAPPALAVAESGSDASMLVVGTRGSGGFAAMVLGSVSRYVAAHAPCPVVVVRQPSMAVRREIAVGIRDPQDTADTLEFAFSEAALRGADLTAVHAWSWFPSALVVPAEGEAQELRPADHEHISAQAASHLTAALGRWRDKYPGVRVRQDVIHGHPARVLASYSARVDLIVLGRHRSPGGAGPGIASVQHAVLDHARGPVAVVPSPWSGETASVWTFDPSASVWTFAPPASLGEFGQSGLLKEML